MRVANLVLTVFWVTLCHYAQASDLPIEEIKLPPGFKIELLARVENAREMALGALCASHAHMAVSVTGIAGPGGETPGKPVGMACFCWASKGYLKTETCNFSGGRADVRRQAIIHALRGIIQLSANTP